MSEIHDLIIKPALDRFKETTGIDLTKPYVYDESTVFYLENPDKKLEEKETVEKEV